MNWQAVADSPAVERLGWTLVHFTWQGCAIALALALALTLMRRRSAQARYGLALAGLAAMMAAPAATYLLMRPAPLASIEPARNTTDLSAALQNFLTLHPQQAAIRGSRLAENGIASVPESADWRERLIFPLQGRLHWLVLAWLLGAAALSLRQLAAWRMVRRLTHRSVRPAPQEWQPVLRRLARRVGVERPVRLLESALVEVPSVIGWLRPVILLPASALTGLLPGQIEAILAHELAHIRRGDYIVNLVQTIAETLLFYHPAVWWIGRRIRHERENCCDDLAIEVLGDRRGYALALTRMEELRTESSSYAMALTGGHLMNRIRRMFGMEEAATAGARWMAGALAGLALTALAVVLASSTPATAQSTGATAASPAAPAGALIVSPPAAAASPAAPAAPAAPIALGKLPGYVAFDPTSIAGDAKPSVEVNLDQALLAMTLGAAQRIDGQVAEVAKDLGLQVLKVRVYEDLQGDEEAIAKKAAAEADKLAGQGWSPIVRVNDGSDTVNVLMKSEASRIRGFFVIVCSGSDFIYANAALDADAASVGARLAPFVGQAMNGKLDIEKMVERLASAGGGASAFASAGSPSAERPETIDSLKEQVKALAMMRDQVQTKAQKAQADAKAIRDQAAALEKAKTSIASPTDDQKAMLQAAQEKTATLKAQLAEREGNRESYLRQIDSLQKQIDELSARTEALQREMDAKKTRPATAGS